MAREPLSRAWAMKKKRTSVLAPAKRTQLRSGGRLSASSASAGSSHNEEPRLQSSDARQEHFKSVYRRTRKVYLRRKFQRSCEPAAPRAVVAHTSPTLPENDCEVNCDDSQDTSTPNATTTVGEKSEESAPPSASPKAREGQRSTRMKRDGPSPRGTMREGTHGYKSEAEAAAASRPQRRKRSRVFKDFVNTSTPEFEWRTFYPDVPFPEDCEQLDSTEQLGEVEVIPTGSEGGFSDISDSANRPFSIRLQTDAQKTSKARRILVENARYLSFSRHEVKPQPVSPAAEAAANPSTLPKEASPPMCPLTPDKSNGECELGNRTSVTPSESAAAAAATDDKDGSWTASDVDSTMNARTQFPKERLTVELKTFGCAPGGSGLLQNGFPRSVGNVKLKKKRPRPKVLRPEKRKVVKPAKIPKATIKRKEHPPAGGAFEHNNKAKRAEAVREHCLRATASAEFMEPASGRKARSRKRQRQNEWATPSGKAAELPSFPTAAEVPDIFTEMASDPRSSAVNLKNSMLPTTEVGGSLSEQRAEFDSAFEQQELRLPDPGASDLRATIESAVQLQTSFVYPFIPIFGGVPAPEGAVWMEEPPTTPRGNALDVPPAHVPFPNSPSFALNENSFGGGGSSDSGGERTSPSPARRKRSTRTQRTRRSLLPAVESAAAGGTDVAPEDQLACWEPSPISSVPAPLQSRESDAQESLQLVVYAPKSSDMVVYQGKRSKAKNKPRVKLDPLTISTFERLMLQGGEATDTDRADENWDEERKLWSGRALAFTDGMRQVLGDRTFSEWRGSLLDSVVGAFLTQNVSDYLSSNAFMTLRAQFPACEDPITGKDVPTEKQSLVMEEISLGECSAGTSADTGVGTPLMAEKLVLPTKGSMESADAGVSHQQENASGILGTGIRDVQVATEVFMKHTHTTVLLAESQGATVAIGKAQSSDEAQKDPDQSDPYSFSDDDLSAETLNDRFDVNGLVIDLGATHLGPAPGALGNCSSMETICTRFTQEPISETVPGAANPVEGNPSKACHSGAPDHGEKCNPSDMAAQPDRKAPSSKNHSALEDKFRFSLNDDSSTGKLLAAVLCATLGKKMTGREEAGEGQRVPLKPYRRKVPRSHRYADMNGFKTNLRLLSGGERADYEFIDDVNFNIEQQETWKALRAGVLSRIESGRDPFYADSVNWEAVRRADKAKLASVIKDRGMSNILATRIKALLDMTYRLQDGSLDLEWVRKLPHIDAQKFLRGVYGLGTKSVECIRLLTLHHPSFPVDTNVGRIVVRLGWVPLEPLPEGTQLHSLESYPSQEHVQKYLWPRLCTLDQQTLYEFHYLLITFGKVFCTKSKPNCNACPMRSECKHYRSALHSARPLLKGPEDTSIDSDHEIAPLKSKLSMQASLEERRGLLMLGGNARASARECIPIIEEPNSPEYVEDIEDMIPFTTSGSTYVELPDVLNPEIEPSACGGSVLYVELNDSSTQNGSEECNMEMLSKGAGQESEGCIEDVVELVTRAPGEEELSTPPSLELVLLPPELASFPAPKLKSIQRLRTVHYVYELPDHHPLLSKMDKRDPGDPCLYLLAIWSPDEVPQAMPKISDDDACNPFACCQSGEDSVLGTLLVPFRTAVKGTFPLNGTYFQVNEVFADHESSHKPIEVPRTLLWNVRRKFVYFGTTVPSIFKGMSREEIQCCFQKGYTCMRAFSQADRQPKVLAARFHQSGAKVVTARAEGLKGRRASKAKVAS